MKKTRRYNEGDLVSEPKFGADTYTAARNFLAQNNIGYDQTPALADTQTLAARKELKQRRAETPKLVPQTRSSFGQAFREARGRGDTTFTWNGKKYTTEMKRAGGVVSSASKRADGIATKGKTRGKVC